MEILINGVSRKSITYAGTEVRFGASLNGRSTATLTLRDPSGAYDPQCGQSVQIYDRNGVARFGGTIENIRKVLLDPTGGTELQLTCVSHEQRLDKRVVQSKVYTSTTAGAVVADLITSFANGENIFLDAPSDVQPGATIDKLIYDYDKRLSEALDELATLSNYVWWVDPDGYLFFVPRSVSTAPWTLTGASILDGSLSIERSRSDLRNREWYRVNWSAFPPTSQDFVGNGTATTFTLTKRVNRIERILLNSVEQSFGGLGVDTDKQWYWSPGSTVITQDAAGPILTASDTLTVEYRGLGDDVIMADDLAAISARAAIESGTGIYEHVTDDQNAVDAATALAKARAYVDAYKAVALTVDFATNRAGLRPGQVLTASVTTPPISGDWLVESVEGTLEPICGEDDFRYQARIIDGSRIGGWLQFWEKLAGTMTSGGGISLGGSTYTPPEVPGFVTPVQPTNWAIGISDTGATISGQPQSSIMVTIHDRPADAVGFTVWLSRAADSTDLTAYRTEASARMAPSGDTVIDGIWRDREAADYTYHAIVTAWSDTVSPFPDPSSVVHSVTVTAAQPVAQPSTFAVSVVTSDQGGVPSGAYKVDATLPSDQEFRLINIDRIWCDSSFTPVTGATWLHFGSLEPRAFTAGSWTQPTTWPLPTAPEYWIFRARALSKSDVDNTVAMPTSNVIVPASTGVGSVAPAAGVTGISLSYSYPDPATGIPEIRAAYTAPGGTFAGVVVYDEPQDQSNLPSILADGTVLADGTHGAGGEWKPKPRGRKKHVTGEPFVYSFGEQITAQRTIRVYINSYNTGDVENPLVRATDAGATPSATLVIDPYSVRVTGEEYCGNPISPVCTVTQELEGSVYVTHVKSTYTPGTNMDGAYVEVPYIDRDGNPQVNRAIGSGTAAENWFTTPNSIQTARVRLRGYVSVAPGADDDRINSYAPGITPEVPVEIGLTSGLVDLGEGIASTVAASVSVVNKVLGVAANGITESLVADFAVSSAKLAAAAVLTSKIASGAVDSTKIANASISNAHIQNLAVSSANIQDAAITTTKIANAAITNALIANLAVSTAQIQDLAVTDAKIASLSVAKLQAGQITVASNSVEAIAVVSAGWKNALAPNSMRVTQTSGNLYGEVTSQSLTLGSGVVTSFQITSGFLTAASAGSPSGLYLVVMVNNSLYKLQLLNP